MNETPHFENDNNAGSVRGLMREWIVLGLCRDESDLRRLVYHLNVGHIDVRKLSVVMLNPGAAVHGDASSTLRTSLIIEGAVRLESDDGSLLLAGPIKSGLEMDLGEQWLLQGVLRALDETLSAWGVDSERSHLLEAGIVAGRCLIVLHVGLSELPSALVAMKRASVENLTTVEHA